MNNWHNGITFISKIFTGHVSMTLLGVTLLMVLLYTIMESYILTYYKETSPSFINSFFTTLGEEFIFAFVFLCVAFALFRSIENLSIFSLHTHNVVTLGNALLVLLIVIEIILIPGLIVAISGSSIKLYITALIQFGIAYALFTPLISAFNINNPFNNALTVTALIICTWIASFFSFNMKNELYEENEDEQIPE
ncbi:hypothetical protein BTZ13_01320 [Staphylococcus condimenti]|uniref:hypothetical protein n=1 Tax=Staphylococcus TaxID=1279 RepID=UPI0008A47195|nr:MULTISPECIES: hypothetical protein [Staphylococcus]APR59921.1 hypothetical protein BTZ13_01320 [Staphylococcus condimenti]MDK8646196.1 hypothetical protein [Staphylococcus condimenti]OFO99833.1 hypothetical protein HMPREF3007_05590 [Staphylococcus sp. HMSC065E08]